ncbi:anti-sigma factor family protein [Peristeroidobacter soli]|jgi:anti-sigma factor RsiW|uniref:anti-sigma factor family protein n=1 Tax=Peristeroidobacter soli TaxID=2497877 RepID=UPI00101BCB72|nr:anti-sigma factor [Peristeroidobacter soli]
MSSPTDPITEADLQGYLENQLPVSRRIEVEAYLSTHPDDAARIMADLRSRDELRLAFADEPRVEHIETLKAARRLERGMTRDRLFRQFRRIASITALIAVGWLAHAQLSPGIGAVASTMPPAYVNDAVMAHRTSLLRAVMISQPETLEYDPEEIRSATHIVLPALPSDWSVRDVQIFPSSFGPSVEIALHTAYGEISLFAVHAGAVATIPTTHSQQSDVAAVYWQRADVAYVLVTRAPSGDLDKAATLLAQSL